MVDAVRGFLERLGYQFTDGNLLERALTHRSRAADNNERLEFLGDSVLGFTISSYLYERFPKLTEGELTRLRARLVRKESLSELARRLELGPALRLGPGELRTGGFDRGSILADALEAVFGAILMDSDFGVVRDVILRVYSDKLYDLDARATEKDPKTRLQEYLQSRGLPTPDYRVLEVSGQAHAQNFHVECSVSSLSDRVEGSGRSRRAAEQDAAEKALSLLEAD
ncbi:MAG: ribonuclease III [Acidiferrobacteraceae bacterium]